MPFDTLHHPEPGHLLQLAYKSRSREDLRPAEIRQILGTSRANNAAAGITGILLHDGQRFLQIIEGEVDRVQALYQVIAGDDRHAGLSPLLQRCVPRRDFAEWRMGFYTWRANTGDAGAAFFFDEDFVERLPASCSKEVRSLVSGFVEVVPGADALLDAG